MKDYVDALVDSGYYKVVAHENPKDHLDRWYLSYIGPSSVKRVFKIYPDAPAKAAIVVSSFIGNIDVFHSLDVITNDIEDTQYRLNNYFNVENPWSSTNNDSGNNGGGSNSRTEESCSICGGDGKRDCFTCNGKG